MVWVANTDASSKPANSASVPEALAHLFTAGIVSVFCDTVVHVDLYKALWSPQNGGLVQLPRDPIENIAKQLIHYLPNTGRGLGCKGVFCRLYSATYDRWNQLKFRQDAPIYT